MKQNLYQSKISRLLRDVIQGGLWRLRDDREPPAAIG